MALRPKVLQFLKLIGHCGNFELIIFTHLQYALGNKLLSKIFEPIQPLVFGSDNTPNSNIFKKTWPESEKNLQGLWPFSEVYYGDQFIIEEVVMEDCEAGKLMESKRKRSKNASLREGDISASNNQK